MKSFDVKEKQSASAVRRPHYLRSTSMNHDQQVQQSEIRRILHSTGAQAKLTVGQPNDKYEQEADRVADEVMRMPDPQVQLEPIDKGQKIIQAKPLANQYAPLVQKQVEPPEEEEKELLQTKMTPGETPTITPDLESKITNLKGGGQPLDTSSQDFFEPRFGSDLSAVRLHTDTNAARTAGDIHARAFTIDNNIAFGPGQYSPESYEGKKLLTHELVHVVQQGRGITSLTLFPKKMSEKTAKEFTHAQGTVDIHRSYAPELTEQPRSKNETLDPGKLTDEELLREITLIRRWLMINPASSLTRLHLTIALQELEKEVDMRSGAVTQLGAEAFEKQHGEAGYGTEEKAGSYCMEAVYCGIGSLFSERVKISAENYVNSKPAEDANMIQIMNYLRINGLAEPPTRLQYSVATDRWTPDPEATILGMTSPSFKGWYFFGLSLHRSYHSVTIVVNKMNPNNPRIFWVDQFETGFSRDVTGRLQVEMHGFEPSDAYPWNPKTGYYRYSQIWKMLPPSEMLLNICNPP